MNTFQKSAAAWNRLFMVIMKAPVLDKIIGRSTGILTYTGRKSGKKIKVPLAFSRSGGRLTVRVAMADKKNWWKNFQGDGAPVDVDLGGVHSSGQAVTRRDERGRVFVDITLT